MSQYYEYKKGGVFSSPTFGGATNTISLGLDELEGGKFLGVPQDGGTFFTKVTIFTEIFMMARGGNTGAGAIIKRAVFLANSGPTVGSGTESLLEIKHQEDSNISTENTGPITAIGTVDTTTSNANQPLVGNANTTPRIAWPFESCTFRATNSGSFRDIAIDFTLSTPGGGSNVGDVFWELTLKGFAVEGD